MGRKIPARTPSLFQPLPTPYKAPLGGIGMKVAPGILLFTLCVHPGAASACNWHDVVLHISCKCISPATSPAQVSPTDVEEGMRVGVDRTKYSVQIPLPPKIDPTVRDYSHNFVNECFFYPFPFFSLKKLWQKLINMYWYVLCI